jgi:hypothetical protein
VTAVCIGTSPLASMPRLYEYEVDDERAEATVEAVLDGRSTSSTRPTATAAAGPSAASAPCCGAAARCRTGSCWPPRAGAEASDTLRYFSERQGPAIQSDAGVDEGGGQATTLS